MPLVFVGQIVDDRRLLPLGGTTGQVPEKQSDTDGDIEWATPSGGGGGGGSSFSDTDFEVYDNVTPTKKFKLQVSGVTGGTTRTITVPDANGTMALTSDITTAVAAEAALARNADNLTSGTVADARIPAAIARDSEVTAAIAALSSVYQAKDTTLDTYSGIDPSANVQAILGAADYAAIRTLLSLVIGTNVQAYNANLTTWAGLAPSANAESLVTAANYAAMRALLDLEAGTDFYSISATDAAIAAAVAGLYDLKGNINCSANPNYPSASKGDVYVVSVAGKIGGASGKTVEAGDTVIATADNAGGTEASVGTSWVVSQGNVAFTTQGLAIATAASYAAIRQLLSLDTGNSPTFLGLTLDGGLTFSAIGGGTINLSADLSVLGGGISLPSITINSVAFAPTSFAATLASQTTAIAALNQLHTQGANIASASTVNLSTATGWAVTITGTTTITAFTSQTAGNTYLLTFSGDLTLTHNATSLICTGGASITTAAGDTAIAVSLGSGNWKILDYTRASGKAVVPPAITETSGLGTGVGTALGNTTNATGGFVTTDGTATLTNKIISLAALPGTDDTYQGIAITGRNAGATIAQWEAVYLNSSGEWVLADANGTSTYPAQGLAVAAYSSGNAATVLVIGTVRNDSWNWTVGGRIYLSATAGALTQTQPSTSGDKVQYIGFAPTADSIFVNPSSTFLEVP